MSEMNKTPIDPFVDVNLDAYVIDKAHLHPKPEGTDQPSTDIDKEAIRKIAEESHFKSRQATQNNRPKLVTKTFSLFHPEITRMFWLPI